MRLAAIQGDRYLFDIGRGDFAGTEMLLGRVYDRSTGTLYDPLPFDAITGRGYWDPPEGTDPELLDRVRVEAEKLA